jgi:GNAT superfamily N-acetyltransferase
MHNVNGGSDVGFADLWGVIMANSTRHASKIRRLWPADMPTFRSHLLRLEPQSRRERFEGGMSDDFIARYAEGCFGRGDLVFGAFVDGCMRGAGELRSSEAIWSEQAPFHRHIHAEAAFSVEEPYRRRGVGAQLFQRIERAASNHGVETIELVCERSNIGMVRLAAKFKMHLAFEENEMAGRLTARRPTPLSLLREASRDAIDYAASLLDAQARAIRPEVAEEPAKSPVSRA